MKSGIRFPKEIGRLLSFNTDLADTGVEIIDHVERHKCLVRTSNSVDPQKIPTERFDFPVDLGIKISSERISLPYSMAVTIRNHAGLMIAQFTNGDSEELDFDHYSIELSAPIKLYIKIKSEFKIEVMPEEVIFDFKNLTEINIGVRSHHERPAGTIRTTKDPEDLMEAISYFGSALKTISCERSYPTLRGHPPKIELGNQIQIPSVLEKPNTGVAIEVPRNLRSIYIVSPLAYYFGADIIPSSDYKLKLENGFVYDLNRSQNSVEKEIKQVLKQCFFLDCITRTEGYYQINLNERKKLEEEVDIDFHHIYDLTLSEQIEAYLNIPYEILHPLIPQWRLTAHVESSIKNLRMIPFLVNDLSIIRSAKETKIRDGLFDEMRKGQHDENSIDISDFSRGNGKSISRFRYKSPINNTQSRGENIEESDSFVQIEKSNSLEQTWVGDGIPVGASKAMIESYENRLNRNMTDGDIEITVIINDNDMIEEMKTVDDIYKSREKILPNVSKFHNINTEKLDDILGNDIDFLHYIGHIDDDGFECIDGPLDISEIDTTGVDTFFLNACSSYKQALRLIQAGAIAGIATVKPILNSSAQTVGKAIARLLNLGFSLMSSLQIAKDESIMGENYVIIGDGGSDVTQPKSGIPSLCDVSQFGENYVVDYMTFPTRKRDIGSITIPYAKNNNEYFLTSGKTGSFVMDKNELLEFLSMGEMPIKINSKLYWSNENKFIKELE